ncbi:MAG: ComEC/Rec2 family competence protein [Flavobacteriaceae bacterium]
MIKIYSYRFILTSSVIRAVTMFSFVAYARYLNRPGNTFNILALSMFFILLINPSLLFQVGFQMSYAAVFAIVWIYPLLQKFWYPKNVVLRKMWQLLSVSIAAQLGVLPISLFYFHQFPGLFFVSNMVIVPFLGLILGIGILVIVLSLLHLLPNFMVEAYNVLIRSMNNVIAWVAQQEAFVFKDISFDAVQLIISYAILIGLVLVATKASFKRTRALLTSIIAFQIWLLYTTYDVHTKEDVLILHQNRNSMLLFRKGNKLKLLSSNPEPNKKIITDYKLAERIGTIEQGPLENSYRVSQQNLYIMDSLRIYPPNKNRPDYVLLTQSPRLNLERFIDSVRPRVIIADGSNYKRDIKRWKASCDKRKLPFHYTGEKGAYTIISIK